MKRFLSVLMVLALLLLTVPFGPVALAAGEVPTIDLLGASFVKSDAGYLYIDLYFSEPVHIFNTGYIWIRIGSPANDHDATTQRGLSGGVTYFDPVTGAGGEYATHIRAAFNKNAGTGATDCLPEGAGISIVEYFLDDGNNNGISPEVVAGLNGERVKSTVTDSTLDFCWLPISAGRITLDSAVADKNIVTLKFSEPVHFFSSSHCLVCDSPDPAPGSGGTMSAAGSYQWLANISYVGGEDHDGDTFSDTVRLRIDRPGNVAHADSYFPPDAGVRITEYPGIDVVTDSDPQSGSLNPQAIRGINGERVIANAAAVASDIAWIRIRQKEDAGAYLEKVECVDPASFTVTLTFTEPVHLFQTGYIWLVNRYSPNPNVGDDYQCGCNGVEYLDPKTGADGLDYSTRVKAAFRNTSGGNGTTISFDSIPKGAGVRIVEYTMSDRVNDGLIATSVIRTIDGDKIHANWNDYGTSDVAFTRIDFVDRSAKAIGVTAAAGSPNKLTVRFNGPVTVSDISKILLVSALDSPSWTAGVSAFTADQPDTVTLTLDGSEDFSDLENAVLILKDGAVQDPYGRGLVRNVRYEGVDVTGCYLDPWKDPGLDAGTPAELEDGADYNFMNCDTGRVIGIGGIDEWTLVKEDGVNLYSIRSADGRYVDLTGGTAVLSAEKVPVRIYPEANERYRLIVNGTIIVADSDREQNSNAVFKQLDAESTVIEAGWYLTKSGEPRPLKVMPLGDSITFGVNPDLPGSDLRLSYRAELSEALTEYFGRVVFVGDQRTAVTDINDTALYRHSGYPGYVVHDNGWNDPLHPGVDVFVEDLVSKYTPDIVCLMLGTNDGSMSGYSLDYIDTALGFYETFVNSIEKHLGSNGLIISASVPPAKDINSDRWFRAFGEELRGLVQRLSDSGKKIAFTDNYGAVEALGSSAISSDGLHLTLSGSHALFESYVSVIKAAYGSDSVRQSYTLTDSTGDAATLTVVSGEGSGILPGNSVSFTVTANDGYENLKVFIDGVEAASVDGVYTIGNILGSHEITVTADKQTEPGPGTTDPDKEDPGRDDPGRDDPGTTDPGTTDPGTTDPSKKDPGKDVPNTGDPLLLCIGCAVLSAAGLGTAVALRKKSH